jgi:hypothetical protein
MDHENTETDRAVALPAVDSAATRLSLSRPAQSKFLLNRLDLPLVGGSVQQAFIHACCAQQINA